jgi:small subunit ribosomal protein S1
LHISELADHKVENPEEIVKVGDEIEVKILRVDTEERKIGLSRKRVQWTEEHEAEEKANSGEGGSGSNGGSTNGGPSTPAMELKGGVGKGGPLIQPAGE